MRLELPFNLIGNSTMANHGAYSNPGTQVRAQNKDFGDFSQTDLTRSLAPLWHRLGNYNRRQNELRHFALELGFFAFYWLQKEKKIAFPPPSPPCNVLPMFELPTEKKKTNTPTLNGRDRGGVRILMFCEVTLFKYNVSTILSPIVGA